MRYNKIVFVGLGSVALVLVLLYLYIKFGGFSRNSIHEYLNGVLSEINTEKCEVGKFEQSVKVAIKKWGACDVSSAIISISREQDRYSVRVWGILACVKPILESKCPEEIINIFVAYRDNKMIIERLCDEIGLDGNWDYIINDYDFVNRFTELALSCDENDPSIATCCLNTIYSLEISVENKSEIMKKIFYAHKGDGISKAAIDYLRAFGEEGAFVISQIIDELTEAHVEDENDNIINRMRDAVSGSM